MSQAKAPPPDGSSAYARNFTLTTAERVRAAIAGPPYWSVRLRRIERLQEEIVSALVAEAFRAGSLPVVLPPPLSFKLATLGRLVASHNAYYPIEANLPSDPRSRAVMAGGEPWRPMEAPSAEALLALARDHLGKSATRPAQG